MLITYRRDRAKNAELRETVIREYVETDTPVAKICMRHGISRPTFYRWLRQHAKP